MRIAGIIAEYNPFHNGHAYHIRETRARAGADFVVAAMDGHFTQRGDLAALAKWTRVRMALLGGVDAVFELPTLYAVRPAETFAAAGVAILNGVGADVLSFGFDAELPGREPLALVRALAGLRACEPAAFSAALRARLAEGMPHARAWGETAAEWLGLPVEPLRQPNAILAVEYARAVESQGARLELCAVPRVGGYHDRALGEYASASAIRAALAQGDARAAVAVPEALRPFLSEAAGSHGLDDVLLDRLRTAPEADLAALADASEGIERRLQRLAWTASDRAALLEALRCRRYTQARLSRLLAQALLGLTRGFAAAQPLPRYARLLGMRREARPLIAELGRRASLPILSRPAELRGDPAFELECRAADLWALSRNAPEERRAGRECTEKFIVV